MATHRFAVANYESAVLGQRQVLRFAPTPLRGACGDLALTCAPCSKKQLRRRIGCSNYVTQEVDASNN